MSRIEDRSTAEVAALHGGLETGVEVSEGVEPAYRTKSGGRLLAIVARFGLMAGLILILVIFGFIKPHSFLTLANLKSTASIAAPLLILSVGLTFPLSMGEFDLSIAQGSQLSMAVVIGLISIIGLNYGVSIVITLIGAALVGGLIGLIVVRSGVNAFIVTLGAGTVMAGLEFAIAKGQTIFSGIPQAYIDIGNSSLGGVPDAVIVALVFSLLAWLLLERTVAGRRMRAIGGNSEAARLSGVRVNELRAFGFVLTAVAGAVTAVVLSSQASSYYPLAVTGQLLPAYAACFLGTTVFRANLFEVTGTFIGVAFLSVIQDGLIMTGVPSWTAQVVQGSILIIAVVASKAASNRAGA